MGKYFKNFTIPYYDTDRNKELTAASILKYLMETSNDHGDSFTQEIEENKYINWGWMIHRWKVKFNRFPLVKEDLRVKTWISSFDKFYAHREFIILDKEEQIIGKATVIMIFLDMKRKRPIRIPIEYNDLYKVNGITNFNDYHDFKEEYKTNISKNFSIRKSDIDYNNHVNNIVYLMWMLEVIPDEIEGEYKLIEIEILYKKEVLYGNNIISIIDEGEFKGGSIEFIHIIIDESTGELHTLGRTSWRREEYLDL